MKQLYLISLTWKDGSITGHTYGKYRSAKEFYRICLDNESIDFVDLYEIHEGGKLHRVFMEGKL